MQEIKLPQLGQSVEEAAIVEWLKKEGDQVAKGDVLFTVQTDKAEIECESTADGVLRKVLLEPDIEVPVMTVVALVGEPDEPLPDLSQYEQAPGTPQTEAVSQEAPRAPAAKKDQQVEPEPADAPLTETVGTGTPPAGESFASPRARRRASELGVDYRLASGTGPGGRIVEDDIKALAESLRAVKITPVAKRMAAEAGLDIRQLEGTGPGGKITKADVETASKAAAAAPAPAATGVPEGAAGMKAGVTPLTPMRRTIAERMCASKFSAPHYYITVEIDMHEAAAFRKSAAGCRPSFNALVLYAAAKALRSYPHVNARWKGDAIEVVDDINLGFAVALPAGLVVPVIRQIQNKSLEAVHNEAVALARKARDGKLTPGDYSGNTFTVSNLGSYGIDQFTAIINQPDSAILAVGRIKDRPVVIDGGIHVRPMMNLTLSSDHRVIDGALAAQFMGKLRTILEAAQF